MDPKLWYPVTVQFNVVSGDDTYDAAGRFSFNLSDSGVLTIYLKYYICDREPSVQTYVYGVQEFDLEAFRRLTREWENFEFLRLGTGFNGGKVVENEVFPGIGAIWAFIKRK
jgi:hypothetical protein